MERAKLVQKKFLYPQDKFPASQVLISCQNIASQRERKHGNKIIQDKFLNQKKKKKKKKTDRN